MGEIVLKLLAPAHVNPAGRRNGRVEEGEDTFFEYDEVLGWRGKAFAKGIQRGRQFSISVQLNSNGFREREAPYEKNDGRTRILVLGDSQTWGSGVEQRSRFTEVLEGFLQQRGINAEVLNFGVVGYATDQELLLFKNLGFRYHPDLVILAFFWNDIFENSTAVAYGYPKPHFVQHGDKALILHNVPVPKETGTKKDFPIPQQKQKIWGATKEWLESNSYVYRLLANAIRRNPFLYRLLVERGIAGGPWRDPGSKEWKLTRRLLEALKETVERSGSQFVVVVVPERWDLESATYPLRKPLIREMLDLPSLDLLPALKAAESVNPLYCPNDIHLNQEGHRIIGRALFEYLIKENMVS